MNNLSPDDFRSLLQRALPLIEHSHLAERVVDYLVTGKTCYQATPPGVIASRDYNRVEYAAHAALFAIANFLGPGAYLDMLNRALAQHPCE